MLVHFPHFLNESILLIKQYDCSINSIATITFKINFQFMIQVLNCIISRKSIVYS